MGLSTQLAWRNSICSQNFSQLLKYRTAMPFILLTAEVIIGMEIDHGVEALDLVEG